jgi:hypothetical protein
MENTKTKYEESKTVEKIDVIDKMDHEVSLMIVLKR